MNLADLRSSAARFGMLSLLGALLTSAAFAACTGNSPNIVCNAAGPITLNTTNATGPAPQTASVYPSDNVVSGLTGTITSVQVRLNGLTHSWTNNMDMILVSPTGQTFVFWSDIGLTANGGTQVNNQTITVSDGAAVDLPAGAISTGSYRPRNLNINFADIWPAPANLTATATNSAAPFGTATFASQFNSANPNGTWKLYISLDSSPDTGSLQSWDLLFAVSVANAATTTSLTSTVNPVVIPLSGNSTTTLTATVTSGGNPVTLGAVSFFAGAQSLGTNVNLNASGQASVTVNTVTGSPLLAEGSHIINANYSGANGFGASSGNLTQVVDRATVVTGNTFCNTGKITLPTANNAGSTPYPSKLFVSGIAGTTQSVQMAIKGFTNPVAQDTNLLLVSPTGQKFIPFAYIGNSASTASNADINLDDNSANTLPGSGTIGSGTFRPAHFTTNPATFLSPAPAAPYNSPASFGSSSFTSAFAGASPNGTWTLYAVNWAGGGPGGVREITNGWCLTIGSSSDPASTTTPLVSPTPTALNQSATISALVASAANGTPVNGQGTVTFKEGNTTLAGPLNLGSNGVASFLKSDLTQGAHFLDAFYSGAPGFFSLSSGQVLHYVDTATTNPSAGRFCNTTALTFPNVINATGTPYPTRINASGLAGTLSKVTIELNGLSHQFPDDLDLMVTGPNGNSLIAFSDVGGGNAVSNLNIVLDSNASSSLPDGTVLSSGNFLPTDFQTGTDTFAVPAPTTNVFSAFTTSLGTAFNNSNPNGIWTLWPRIDSAGSQGGGSLANGWCVNLTMTAPQLTISKTHSGNFTQGQTGAQYTVTVGSSGPGSTVGTITVVDTVPAGLTVTAMSGSGWSCTVNTATCTTSATIAANGTLPSIIVTVSVASNATSPQVNSATVSGGGAIGATANDSTIITQAADLTISKTTSSTFVQGGTATYSLIVNNVGAGASSGNYTISDTMPTGLTIALPVTGSIWDCTASTTTLVSCVRSTAIPANVGSAPSVTVNVNIASNAPLSITNTATVAGGGELNTDNNSGSVTSNVTAQTGVTINVPAGITYTFNGQTVTGSQTFNVAPGTYVLSTTTPQTLGVGTQAVFATWSDSAVISRNVVVGSSAITITGTFTTQYRLTTAASPSNGGTVTPASGTFYNSGTVVNLAATPNSGFVFASWTGAVANPNAASTTVTMDAAKSVTANFTAQTGVTINVPAGITYTFNGQTVTGSQTFNVAPGTYVLSTTTPQTLGVGTQAVFSTWSDSAVISRNVVVGSSAITITGTFTTQYRLTTAASPSNGGTVTPASGTFYNSGTVVNLSATANSGFVFASWTGAVANPNAASTTVTMDAPKSATANFNQLTPAPNVTSQVTITRTVPAFNRATGRFSQQVTITNNGLALAASALVFDALDPNFAVFQPSGFTALATPAGVPYKEAGSIGAGQSVTVTVEFTRSAAAALTYTPRVLGAGTR